MSVLQRLLKGDFNSMAQTPQTDGTVLVVLIKRGDPHVYKMWVKDLYQPTQQVISEEVSDQLGKGRL